MFQGQKTNEKPDDTVTSAFGNPRITEERALASVLFLPPPQWDLFTGLGKPGGLHLWGHHPCRPLPGELWGPSPTAASHGVTPFSHLLSSKSGMDSLPLGRLLEAACPLRPVTPKSPCRLLLAHPSQDPKLSVPRGFSASAPRLLGWMTFCSGGHPVLTGQDV